MNAATASGASEAPGVFNILAVLIWGQAVVISMSRKLDSFSCISPLHRLNVLNELKCCADILLAMRSQNLFATTNHLLFSI
jgi:hypothetical protein